MNVKHLMLFTLILLILSVSAVSAYDGQNQTLKTSFEEIDESDSLGNFYCDELEQSSNQESLKKSSDEVLGDADIINYMNVEQSVIYGSGEIFVSYSSDAIGDVVLAVNGKEYKVDKIYDDWGISNSGVAKINNDLGIGNYS